MTWPLCEQAAPEAGQAHRSQACETTSLHSDRPERWLHGVGGEAAKEQLCPGEHGATHRARAQVRVAPSRLGWSSDRSRPESTD